MAVTNGQLAVALRLQVSETETVDAAHLSIITRLAGVADSHIALLIPTAPDNIKDECKVRMVGYLFDQPISAPGERFSNAWRNSGAAALASRWRVRRAVGS